MNVSNMTLVKIAAMGGIATVTMGLMARGKINDNIKATSFYKEALKLVRAHPGAVSLLGEPIKDKSLNLESKNNFCIGNEAQYEVPLRGTKQKGILYFWAQRENEEGQWNVNRIELELAKHPDKRLIIKKSADNT